MSGFLNKALKPIDNRRVSEGFTLTELCVVVAIIALLSGLLFVGLQAVRESSRSAACQNNLRQTGIAMLNYESSQGFFPRGVYPDFSGFVAMLPYIDESARFEQITNQASRAGRPVDGSVFRRPDFLNCPSDQQDEHPTRTSYLGNYGTAWLLDGFGKGVFGGGAVPIRFADIKDGSSHTIAISEFSFGTKSDRIRLIDYDGFAPSLTVPLFDRLVNSAIALTTHPTHGEGWYKNGLRFAYYTHYFTPGNKSGKCNPGNLSSTAYTPSSNHYQKVNSLRADGAVHAVGYAIDRNIWVQLGHREDGGKSWF